MKKFLLSIFFICLSATMIHAQNLITNGGFETWTVDNPLTTMPTGWEKGSGAVGTNYLNVTDAAQGNVLRLVEPTSGSVSARRFNTTTNFSISTEGVYRVTFKVKGNVGLRAVVLVKGTTAPSTSAASATNHIALISEYPSGTNVADWTTLQYDITVPSTATFGTDYRLHFSWSSSAVAKPICDYLIDDISLVKYVAPAVTSDKLSKIEITPAGYTPGTGTADMTIPGFNQDALQYTFTSSYQTVPVVSATAVDATANVQIVQATSLTGSQAERTCTITVTTTDSKTKTYTVEFIKHPGFISGISWNLRSDNYVEWESASGVYTRDSQSAANYYAFGNTSARCNSSSTTGYYLTTPVLGNGASTLKFYLKNTDIAGDNTEVVIKKSTTASPDWTETERVQPNTQDYSNVWKEVTMNINDNSAGLRIRFEFAKTIDTSGKVYLDDVLIQPYSPSTLVSENLTDGLTVYSHNGKIYFSTSGKIHFSIYNMNGSKIAEGIANQGSAIALPKGVYIVKTQEKTIKIIL